MARPSNQKLSPAATMVKLVRWSLVKPAEAFMLMAQMTSSRPATRRRAQAVAGVIAFAMTSPKLRSRALLPRFERLQHVATALVDVGPQDLPRAFELAFLQRGEEP